ncbi:MAG: peptide ABC transporter substrate-binding protein [Chloroflexi bacterium]|nr:peptide ABC transporter substrate-binding protein [Chloroflexota bacterium]
MRWPLVLAFVGALLIGALLVYLGYTVSTEDIPDVGGTYIEGLAGNPRAINPLYADLYSVDRDICALVFNGLTRINERGEIVPDLADRWQVSADERQYTFFLRSDIRWHDGHTFSAADVVFTTGVIHTPAFAGSESLIRAWQNVRVEQIDDLTVRFTLPEPYAPFLEHTTLGIVPKHLLGDIPVADLDQSAFSTHPVGTGIYKIKEVAADHILLEAYDGYYGQHPYITKVEFRFYPDYDSVLAAYRRGEILGVSRVPIKDLAAARTLENLQVYTTRLSGYRVVYLNLRDPIFQEPEVRQALLYALDRQKLIDDVLDGQGIVAHSPIMPNSWAYDPTVRQYPYDPARARDLLQAAGWQDTDDDGIRDRDGEKLEFTLSTNNDPLHTAIISEISRQWAQVGVRAYPETTGWTELVQDYLPPRRFDSVLLAWEQMPVDPDAYPWWHSTQITGTGQNYASWVNRDASEALEQARLTTNREERLALYLQFQTVFADQVPSLLLYYPLYHYGVDREVRNVHISPLIEPADRFRHIADWYIKTRRVMIQEQSRVR